MTLYTEFVENSYFIYNTLHSREVILSYFTLIREYFSLNNKHYLRISFYVVGSINNYILPPL